ncbi:glycosyltransferase [Luteimonas huabeiensis]|uniref:glycosyltransferase n=1 Tax=Luteimonas huabeiensis TaxID=1244513 RepID=UPI00046654A6|nr:glycosyltransferase [Luteimonas huabeiensis]
MSGARAALVAMGWRIGRIGYRLRNTWAGLRRRGLRGSVEAIAAELRRRATMSAEPMAASTLPAGDTVADVLVIDQMLPDPTRDSGSVRLLAILRLLQASGRRVAFMPDNGRDVPEASARLRAIGVALIGLPGAPALPAWLKAAAGRRAMVLLCRCEVASRHLSLVRALAPDALAVFDTVDLHHLRERRAARRAGDARGLARVRRIERMELDLVARCDATLVVSTVERDYVAERCPQARIEVLSNVHEARGPGPAFTARHGMIFIGGFGHPPNREAVAWLVGEILPRVREALPGLPLHLVGDVPPKDAAALERAGVTVHGRVVELAPLLDAARVSVAPLLSGAGVKGKINTAMSHGLPVVTTRIGAEGMHLAHGHDALIVEDASAFAAAVVDLHEDEALWNRLVRGGLENVEAHFSPAAAARTLEALLPRPAGTARGPT